MKVENYKPIGDRLYKLPIFRFPTLEHAWAGLNKYLANELHDIEEFGGGIYSSEIVMYNSVIKVDKAWVSPNFDFGHILGYTTRKWSKLVSNYVDRNYLDLVKQDVLAKERKKSKNYTHAFHFSNKHTSGKDCLISLTFTRSFSNDSPTVIYHTRAMECTKRVIFDFLLIQKIVEYVYGNKTPVDVVMYIPYMFISVEGFLLYTNYENIETAITNHDKPNKFQKRILDTYEKFMKIDISKIKYRVHARSAKGIQRCSLGKPLHKRDSYLAKDITLFSEGKFKETLADKLDK